MKLRGGTEIKRRQADQAGRFLRYMGRRRWIATAVSGRNLGVGRAEQETIEEGCGDDCGERCIKSTPKGSRTPVSRMRTWRPGPLDDGGVVADIKG